MLVLTRKAGEAIIIGDNIELIVTHVRGNQVRIAVKAPKDVTIHREEIYNLIQKEKQEKEQKDNE